ncbi:MAG: cytochrome c [Bacteroidetes bacterium]|nr:cytochrome c [Bacteroidota bacterium]
MKKIGTLIFIIVVLASACQDDDKDVIITTPQELCDSLDIHYTQDVAHVLANAGCSGSYCHGGGSGGVNLSDWANTKTAAESPKFLKAVKHELSASPMPKGGQKLSDADIEILECWIKSGSRE